jgi:hypothetical protein
MTDRRKSRGRELAKKDPARPGAEGETRSTFDAFYRRCSRSTTCTSQRRFAWSMGGNTGPTKARSLTYTIAGKFTRKDDDRNLLLNSSGNFGRK